MAYIVDVSRSAEREICLLPDKTKNRVIRVIDGLEDEPRPAGARKLRGRRQDFRIRVGDYRVLYEVDDAQRTIIVWRVSHRRDAYR